GTDANVKELKRLKLQEKNDLFTGITSSGNTPALGPVAEELKALTIFVDGCTDFLFDKAVPNPKYVFRITNIQSADGVTCALAIANTYPDVRKVAHIHPDYSYGRNAFDHLRIVMEKMLPGVQVVMEGWPKLGTTDFTAHITKAISAKPDLLVSSVWGGDYIAFYKQALGYGLSKQMKFATTLALGVAPHALGKDHPEGVIGGIRVLPAGQPPGVQGRDDGLHQELPQLPVPDPRPDPGHHDPDSEHHRPAGMAAGRADPDVRLDQQDLAEGEWITAPDSLMGQGGPDGRPCPG